MRTGRLAAVLMVVLALATAAVGQSAPAGPREPTWGATPEAVIRAYPNAQCAAERAELSDWWCILSDTTVDAVSVDVVLYGYTTGTVLGMVGVALGFDSGDVHRILEILVARYGRWSRVVEREFVTKADTRFRSAIWLWYLPDVEIRVEQDRGTLGHGQATVMLRAGLAELQARERGSKMRDGGEAVEAPR